MTWLDEKKVTTFSGKKFQAEQAAPGKYSSKVANSGKANKSRTLDTSHKTAIVAV